MTETIRYDRLGLEDLHLGEGTFETTLADGSVVVLTKIPLELVSTGLGWFNIRNYGAKGDGIIDDTAAIQKAITAANAVVGGTVFVPGTAAYYRIVTSLTLPRGVSVVGSGFASHLKIDAEPDVDTFIFNQATSGAGGDSTIRSLRLSGPAADPYLGGAALNAYGIRIRDGANFRIEHCRFENFTADAIRMDGSVSTDDPSQIIICNNLIRNSWRGIWCKHGISSLIIANNIVEGMNSSGIVNDDASSPESYGPQPDRTIITGNIVKEWARRATTAGIVAQANRGIVVSNNVLEGVGNIAFRENGISVTGGGNATLGDHHTGGAIVVGNTVRNASGSYGISAAGLTAGSIIANNSILNQGWQEPAGTTSRGILLNSEAGAATIPNDGTRILHNTISYETGVAGAVDIGIDVIDSAQLDVQLVGNLVLNATTPINDVGTRTVNTMNWTGTGDTSTGMSFEIDRDTGSATPTPAKLTIRSRTNGLGDWSTSSHWGAVDFTCDDVSGSGVGLRARLGVYMTGVAGDTGAAFISCGDAASQKRVVDCTGTTATGQLGVFGATPVTKPTVTGSRGANAALASLLTALAAIGLLTDSSS